jgi:predicted transcriptional regulator YdeE
MGSECRFTSTSSIQHKEYDMRVMVIVKASQGSEAGEMPSQQLLAEMGNYNEELVKAGILQAGEGLKPSSAGKRVRFSGASRTVIDGPFAETKELIAGFWVWKVKSMEEAVAWVKRCPNPMNEDSDIEIRPIFEADDFEEVFTPELREQEAAIRAQTLGLDFPRFETAPPRNIAGLSETYTFETRVNIPRQWNRFAPQIGRVPGQNGPDAYGVVWNYKPDCGFAYLTGVEVAGNAALPDGFTRIDLPEQRYAVFAHGEHVSAIPKTLDAIWTRWVPECGLKIAEAPCFERYTAEFSPARGIGGIEIWIPLAE